MQTYTHGRATVEMGQHAGTVRVDDDLVITCFNNGQPPTNHTSDLGLLTLGFVALIEFKNNGVAQ